jgi:hypothetical protein
MQLPPCPLPPPPGLPDCAECSRQEIEAAMAAGRQEGGWLWGIPEEGQPEQPQQQQQPQQTAAGQQSPPQLIGVHPNNTGAYIAKVRAPGSRFEVTVLTSSDARQACQARDRALIAVSHKLPAAGRLNYARATYDPASIPRLAGATLPCAWLLPACLLRTAAPAGAAELQGKGLFFCCRLQQAAAGGSPGRGCTAGRLAAGWRGGIAAAGGSARSGAGGSSAAGACCSSGVARGADHPPCV